jgi:exosome complex component RRP4
MLHTRSTKYGKLKHGMLVAVPSHLIKRLKHHFHKLPCGVNVILGCNGYVWVAPPAAHGADHLYGVATRLLNRLGLLER